MMAHENIASNSGKHVAPPKTAHPIANRSPTLTEAFKMLGAVVRYERNTEIFGEEEPAEHFYQVVTGAVRTYKVLSDGRRQIGAFHLPGDVFGLEAGQNHRFSAETVTKATIRVAKHRAIVGLAARDPDIANELWTRTANILERAQDHMLLLGRKSAEERVASFFLQMAERAPAERTVELLMSRRDIADYLGLTIETVSRTITHLTDTATIKLAGSRCIRLCNRQALQRLDS